jgi:undecaprenyl diphosphate synthase
LPDNKLTHIALILDGNKRWAKNNKTILKKAYNKGLNNIINLINNCIEINLKYLTLFTLSSENLYRDSVKNIFEIIYDDFYFFFEKIVIEKKVKIKIIGSKDNLPKKILNLIDHYENETKHNNQLLLNLAFNYGFKNEIKQVLQNIIKNKKIEINNQKQINELFFLGNIPDPDILIRTGGEKRLSNFIMYNLTYTEIFFIDTLWPDFNKEKLTIIIKKYNKISRRYGL